MYFSPTRPRSAASRWPRATSRTWTRLSPVSTVANIFPRRKSTIICPVGVGFTSHGPMGADGFTITRGSPFRAKPSATCSARNLEVLYGPTMSASVTGVVSVPGAPSLGIPSAPTVDVYTTRRAPASPEAEHGAVAFDVDPVELVRVARPQAVIGRDVKHGAHALDGAPERRGIAEIAL